MELEPKYLTYEEYQDIGGDLSESSFNILEYRAEKKVDLYTFNRFRKIEEYPDELKMCIYDLLYLVNDEGNNILSESIGNYSVTKKSKKEINKDIKDIILSYLSNYSIDDVLVTYIGADEN